MKNILVLLLASAGFLLEGCTIYGPLPGEQNIASYETPQQYSPVYPSYGYTGYNQPDSQVVYFRDNNGCLQKVLVTRNSAPQTSFGYQGYDQNLQSVNMIQRRVFVYGTLPFGYQDRQHCDDHHEKKGGHHDKKKHKE